MVMPSMPLNPAIARTIEAITATRPHSSFGARDTAPESMAQRLAVPPMLPCTCWSTWPASLDPSARNQ